MVTPSYMLAILDEFRAAGRRSARDARCKIGIFGAEPWTNAMRAEIEQRLRHARGRHLRPVRGDGAGRRQRVRRDQGRPAHLGGSFLSRDHRSRDRRRCCPTASRASWCSPRSPRRRCRSSAIARATSRGCCPAPRASMRRMEKITGRSDDMMIVRGVNVFPTQIEELILQRRAARAAFRHRAAARGPARHDDGEGRGAPGRRRGSARGLQPRSRAPRSRR